MLSFSSQDYKLVKILSGDKGTVRTLQGQCSISSNEPAQPPRLIIGHASKIGKPKSHMKFLVLCGY